MTFPTHGLGVIASAAGGGGGTAYKDAVLGDNPIAYWRLDITSGSTVPDETGNYADLDVLNGSAIDQPPVISGDGRSIYCKKSGGTGGVESNGDAIDATSSLGSVELWVRTKVSAPADMAIFATRENRDRYMYINANGELAGGMYFGNYDEVVGPVMGQDVYHCVLTWDISSGFSLYLNGSLVGSHSESTSDAGRDNPTRWGHEVGGPPSGSTSVDGDIDEIAVYDYQLSATQVSNHYNAGT